MEEEARRKEAWGGGKSIFHHPQPVQAALHVLSIRLLIYNKGSNGLTRVIAHNLVNEPFVSS